MTSLKSASLTYVRIGDHVSFRNGLNYTAADVGDGLKLIGVTEFKDNFTIDYDKLPRVRGFDDIPDDNLLKNNDLLFVRSNGNRELIGRVLFIQDLSERVGHSGFTIRARVTSAALDPLYAAIFFTSDFAKEQIHKHGSGTNISNLSQEILSDVQIPLPSLPEQKAITEYFRVWDRGIRQLTDLIAAKVRFKQGLMQQILTGKRRFPEFSGQEWSRVHLNDLLREEERYVDWDDDAEYRLVSIRRRSGGMFFREAKHGRDIKTQVMKTTLSGDFVIARMQAVHGAMAVTPPEFDGYHVSDSYTTFVSRDPDRLWMPFLNYLSQTAMFYRLALLSAYGVTIEKMTFNLDWFLAETVSLPQSLDEQMKIASVLETADKEIYLLQAQLDALKQQKKGLMQKLLTGEVRVML